MVQNVLLISFDILLNDYNCMYENILKYIYVQNINLI